MESCLEKYFLKEMACIEEVSKKNELCSCKITDRYKDIDKKTKIQ